MQHGGKRPGAGRKVGSKNRIKKVRKMFARRVTPEEYDLLTKYLDKIRETNNLENVSE